ncbi:CAP domain-containing protein [Rhodobacter capsulatus]|uniref:CAP domain-containing protein n=1 Tax=Rhodobacter capsulatus TaxID=1061 RepID=UPI0040280034
MLARPAAVLALLCLAACAAAPTAPPPAPGAAAGPRLPGRVVWTDGHGDVAVAAAGRASCPATSAAMAATGLAVTNATRAQAGLAPMRSDPVLDRVAAAHACDMANRGTMTHAGSATTGPMARARQMGYRPQTIAENIAAGRFGLNGTLEQWSASPKHRANITIPSLRDFGIGTATAADGKTTFWTAVYAR